MVLSLLTGMVGISAFRRARKDSRKEHKTPSPAKIGIRSRYDKTISHSASV